MKDAYFLVACVLVAAVGAWTDWRKGTIPNQLTLPALTLGLLGHFVAGLQDGDARTGLLALAHSMAGVLAAAIGPLMLFRMKGIGAGDVKLFAAVGALAGFFGGLEISTYAFFTAALVAPGLLAYRGVLFRTLGRTVSLVANPLRKNKQEAPAELFTWFRLGPCVLLASCITLLSHLDAFGGP